MTIGSVLIVDSENLVCRTIGKKLKKEGFTVESAGAGSTAQLRFEKLRPEIVLIDYDLPDMDGLELLGELKNTNPDLHIILFVASSLGEIPLQAFNLGADDVFAKPFNVDDIVASIKSIAAQEKLARRRLTVPPKKVCALPESDRLVGSSPAMMNLFRLISLSAQHDSSAVLITGESGTGKELVANAVHNESSRRDKPFIDINCASIPENLLENELFGHEKGAFTDARDCKQGIFERANGGTVFLDEIGDMPFHMQAKILKVVENKRFRRLGGQMDIDVDVRVISATHQDLQLLIADGRFRADLFYRLCSMVIPTPALRNRKPCIPALVDYFISRFNAENGRSISGIDEKSLQRLINYNWPGNVRELRNVIERGMLYSRGNTLTIEPSFPGNTESHSPSLKTSLLTEEACTGTITGMLLPPEGINLDDLEKDMIIQALDRHNGNQLDAAKCLGISLYTFRYRRRKHDISLEKWGTDRKRRTGDKVTIPQPANPKNYFA